MSSLRNIDRVFQGFGKSERTMPALFVGHGSPMNAVEDNPFSRAWKAMAAALPQKPKAILCVSAHWQTRGVRVTAMEQPRTIHDFGGFPDILFQQQYPAPGATAAAKATSELLSPKPVALDHDWGLDHGAWSVLKHMFPQADVPVFQLSLDVGMDFAAHVELARQLGEWRQRSVLIFGSGNIVHNLRTLRWGAGGLQAEAYPWAEEFDRFVKNKLTSQDMAALTDPGKAVGALAAQAHPTSEHYLPMLYVAAQRQDNEALTYYAETIVGGSISMRSFAVG